MSSIHESICQYLLNPYSVLSRALTLNVKSKRERNLVEINQSGSAERDLNPDLLISKTLPFPMQKPALMTLAFVRDLVKTISNLLKMKKKFAFFLNSKTNSLV